jgi:hypothetical protein
MLNEVTSFSVAMTVLVAGLYTQVAGQQADSRSNPNAKRSEQRKVIINRVRLGDEDLAGLEQKYRTRLQDGSYWYDKISGAWGIEGGPTLGIGVAGLNIGGPLRADASSGTTKVFINGRELHYVDVLGLRQLGPVYQGRYWVDAYGNCGVEGGPAFVNLVQLANSRARSTGGGAWSYSNNSSWAGGDGNGGMFFQGKDLTGNSVYWSK